MAFCSPKIATAVWELTLKCNAKCLHCGSAAGCDRPNNLSFDQARSVVRQLNDIGCSVLTLIGGEYFLYPHWKELLTELSNTNIKVAIITNGLALTDDKLDYIKQAHVRGIGISIDGATAATHDRIRQVPGCYQQAWNAAQKVHNKGLSLTIITTINKLNIVELKAFRNLMLEKGYHTWQMEHSALTGRMKKELALDDFGFYCCGIFAAQTLKRYQGRELDLFCMHNFGYYSKTLPNHVPNKYWTGCMAGRKNLGIRSDGTIVGCLALYDDAYIEGNVKETPIAEIRKHKDFCSWNHRLKKFKALKGHCAACPFALVCLGGCEATTPTQQMCYHAIEQWGRDNISTNSQDRILQALTQGYMDKNGVFYLKDKTPITDAWIDTLELDDYHKDILRILT